MAAIEVGRYAPSPSGRMHLGNLSCCLLAWLSAKSAGGRVVLRIEDLDSVRCPRSSEPVFVAQGGSTDLWVRVGNSTRAFGVDEAVTYVARHFKPSLGDLLRPRR